MNYFVKKTNKQTNFTTQHSVPGRCIEISSVCLYLPKLKDVTSLARCRIKPHTTIPWYIVDSGENTVNVVYRYNRVVVIGHGNSYSAVDEALW